MKSYMKVALPVIIAVLAGVGVLYWYAGQPRDMVAESSYPGDAYPYNCTPAAQVSLIPSADMANIRLEPFAGATFPTVTTFMAAEDAAKPGAEYVSGAATLVGQGEKVTITIEGKALECYPVPNPDSAPINFGD